MIEKFNGIVIRENKVSESDKILTVLTREKGKIFIRAQHANKNKKMILAGTSLLCYAEFVVSEATNIYFLRQCTPTETFYSLSEDILKLSLATYLGQLTSEVLPEGIPQDETLSLLLNTLYLLSKSKKSVKQLKCLYELRLMSLQGYMPSLLGCNICGEKNFPMLFDKLTGHIYCKQCSNKGSEINETLLNVMQYIVYSEPKKVFSFEITDEFLDKLCDITENYIIEHLGEKVQSLEYLKLFI